MSRRRSHPGIIDRFGDRVGRIGLLGPPLLLLAAGCAGRALEFEPELSDGGPSDLAHHASIDFALPADLAPPLDFAPPIDFAPRLDLARPIDLARPVDFEVPPDLTPAADLFVPPGYPAPHPPLPQAVKAAGPILAPPVITVVTFMGDPLAPDAEAMVGALAVSGYWKQTTSEYGVGAPILRPPIHLAGPPAGTLDDSDIIAWLTTELDGKHPDFGAPAPNAIYVLVYPKGTRLTLDGGRSCFDFDGYHNSLALPNGKQVAYAALPRCPSFGGMGTSLDSLTLAISHELIEGTTDPYPLATPAWTDVDKDSLGWGAVIGGAELGDLCEYNPDLFVKPGDIGYTVQRTWSNAAAKLSRDPCVPAAPNQFYFNTAPVLTDTIQVPIDAMHMAPTKGMSIPAGKSKTIELDLFSQGPTPNWDLSVRPSYYGSSQFDFTFDKTSGKNGDKLHLTVAVNSADPSGQDGFFIISTMGGVQRLWPVAVNEP